MKSQYEQSKKTKCPNCGAKANRTSFTVSKNVYKAVCVNVNTPCPLSIEIYNGTFESLQHVLINYRDIFEEVKQHIIQLRMKYLFWYGTSIGRTVDKQPEENKLFVEEFNKLMERFTVAKQQYTFAVEQYHESQFMFKEQAAEVNSLSNSISDIYNSLRESFPDLVLSWEHSDSEREILRDMIREQIRADDMKKKRARLQYSLQGSIQSSDTGYGMSSRMIQYVGGLDDLAFNTTGKTYSVRKFVLDEPQEEEKSQPKIVIKTASKEEEPQIQIQEEFPEEEEEQPKIQIKEDIFQQQQEEQEQEEEEEEEEKAAPKQKRCPKGERRNKKTGKCEPKPNK